MPRAKTWAELSRRQRREVRAWLRDDIRVADHGFAGYGKNPDYAEALRAALAELREPKKETGR